MLRVENLKLIFIVSSILGIAVSYSKVYLFHILFICLSTFYILEIIRFKKIRFNRFLHLHNFFYFMLFWYFISILWSINIFNAFIYIFYIIFGTFLSLTIISYSNNLEKQNRLFKVMAYVFIIEIIICLLESFTDFRFPISPYSDYAYFFGKESYLNNVNEISIKYLKETPTGFQWNPNNLAITMLIILPFFIYYKNKLIRISGIISIFIIILMSGSRGVFIACIFMFVLYLFFTSKKRLIYSFLFIPIIILLLSNNFIPLINYNTHISEIISSFDALFTYLSGESEEKNSISERQLFIKNALNALINSAYLGVGPGGAVIANGGGSIHNFWIELLTDSGVFFTIIFFVWYLYILFRLYIISFRSNNELKYYAEASFLALSGFLIGAVSASSVIYFFPMWILLGFSISTIYNFKRSKNEFINIR